MNIESATLVLRTINANNNAIVTSSTWRVNLRQCLGNLYNKYSKFKICLTSWGTALANTGFTGDDTNIILFMSGPQWENQTYDTVTNGLRERACITALRFSNNGFGIENFTGEVGQVFIKPNRDEIDINISIEKVSGAALPAIAYPQSCYVFSIFGLVE